MSQNNIGEFIQQSRKAKGFTQKDLGDRIGVSDKTISKWENGNSIPDTSILNELCATLDINVNELLSGEKLTPEIYSMKAEENMMNPRLYTTSYNKPQGQQFDDTAVLSFIKLQYT